MAAKADRKDIDEVAETIDENLERDPHFYDAPKNGKGATDTSGESRRVTRNDPILVSLDTADGVLVIEVRELPWRKRNDLGELVLHTYQDAVNRLIEPDGSATRVDVGLIESLIDYQGILAIAF